MNPIARYLALLAALYIPTAFCYSCATVSPVIHNVVVCSGKTIPGALVEQVYTDVMTENWADIVLNIVPILTAGWSDLKCILDALKQGRPEIRAKAAKFETAHRAQLHG